MSPDAQWTCVLACYMTGGDKSRMKDTNGLVLVVDLLSSSGSCVLFASFETCDVILADFLFRHPFTGKRCFSMVFCSIWSYPLELMTTAQTISRSTLSFVRCVSFALGAPF